MKNPKFHENPLGFIKKVLRKFHMKSKKNSYEKLTLVETYRKQMYHTMSILLLYLEGENLLTEFFT